MNWIKALEAAKPVLIEGLKTKPGVIALLLYSQVWSLSSPVFYSERNPFVEKSVFLW